MNRAQSRNVVQGMMRAAKGAVTHAGADADEPNRDVRVADVVLDLFERSCREKAGGRYGKWLLARSRKSSGDTHEVLLRHRVA